MMTLIALHFIKLAKLFSIKMLPGVPKMEYGLNGHLLDHAAKLVEEELRPEIVPVMDASDLAVTALVTQRKQDLVTHKNVPSTQNGRNGHHVPAHVAEEAKTGRVYVFYL